MTVSFGSVCSGIEAASVAWHPLGWRTAWVSEIDTFPSVVLRYRLPGVVNLGDMATIAQRVASGAVEPPDVLVGGTPCQAFSVAGLRAGLSDARGQLALAFVLLANAIDAARSLLGKPPCVVVWENVPGVLSDRTNAFGHLLGALAGEDEPLVPAGKRWTNAGVVLGPQRATAWRVLDAQYFGVAQRRRRLFVVSSARAGFDPAAVLFEFDGVRRDSAPSREAWENAAASPGACPGSGRERRSPVALAGTLSARSSAGGGLGTDFELAGGLQAVLCLAHGQAGAELGTDRSPTLTCNHEAPIAIYPVLDARDRLESPGALDTWDAVCLGVYAFQARIARNGRGDMGDLVNALTAQAGATGRGDAAPCIASVFAFKPSHFTRGKDGAPAAITPPLSADADKGDQDTLVLAPTAMAFAENSRGEVRLEGGDGTRTGALSTGGGKPGQGSPTVALTWRGGYMVAMAVRRLTPVECERLQGFPDRWTYVPYRGKPAADGPRYKSLGNSMAVPCMAFIGRRIDAALHTLKGSL